MATINCPMCGKSNPAELEVCQFCEARLKPVTDELSRSQPPIRPGEQPKEVDTGQLESVLPKWLRDIRQQSRESADEEPVQPVRKKEEPKKPEEKGDFLAGLRSQSEPEDEIPDWLADLRGEGSKGGPKEMPPAEDDDMAALRSMLGEDVPAPPQKEDSPLPDWASGLGAVEEEQPAQAEPDLPASGSDFRWDADFGADSAPTTGPIQDENAFDTGLPSWLQDKDDSQIQEADTGLPAWMLGDKPPVEKAEGAPFGTEGDLPAWLQDKDNSQQTEELDTGLPAWMRGEEPAAPQQSVETPSTGETDLTDWLASLGAEDSSKPGPSESLEPGGARSTTDWLSSLDREEPGTPPPSPTESAIKSTTDWLSSLGQEPVQPDSQPETPQPTEEGMMPDWLSSLGADQAPEVPPQEPEAAAEAGELPDWLASLGEESSQALPQEAEQTSGTVETPDWLSSLSRETTEEAPSQEEKFVEPFQAAQGTGLPAWLAALGETAEEPGQSSEEEESAPFEFTPAQEPSAESAFVDDEGEPISKEDVDAIFSMDMPEWLSASQADAVEEAAPGAPEEQEDQLRPADLPSWVQAMRPVESVISETQAASAVEEPVEERGPLAGLRGVLPAMPGVGPSSKPKAHSIKLQATEDQLSNAALLENMLAEETRPLAIAPQKVLGTQRLLRLVITILFLSIVGLVFFSGTRINPISPSVPPETSAFLNYVQTSLPANAPVLMVFDYQAALAGELEAAALPVVDQMLTLKAPRLGLVASTPAGAVLSERFMQILLADREYARNEKFVNLGYLPGGAAGVQAFARNPGTTKPFTTTGGEAWTTPALQDVTGLSNFAAILLLTDDIESARVWIEQTQGIRGETPLLVVSSAQSGPMIRPYVNSGQVEGMIAGLDNSAPIEQANSGRPGMARRYWDAYGFGLLTAVLMIAVGALWSLFSNWQALRKEQREG